MAAPALGVVTSTGVSIVAHDHPQHLRSALLNFAVAIVGSWNL
ncbi:MAG TPA: hypothetical protein VNW96_21945 [Mycobacterium sp.]|nr:hypothetical protein [Mycobacterium sp.]